MSNNKYKCNKLKSDLFAIRYYYLINNFLFDTIIVPETQWRISTVWANARSSLQFFALKAGKVDVCVWEGLNFEGNDKNSGPMIGLSVAFNEDMFDVCGIYSSYARHRNLMLKRFSRKIPSSYMLHECLNFHLSRQQLSCCEDSNSRDTFPRFATFFSPFFFIFSYCWNNYI